VAVLAAQRAALWVNTTKWAPGPSTLVEMSQEWTNPGTVPAAVAAGVSVMVMATHCPARKYDFGV
jgi:hypothetical protein